MSLSNWELYNKNLMMCRACLSNQKELLHSFLDNPSLFDIYIGCTYLQVEINDGLPMNLCSECINKLSSWYSFKQICEQNEATLKIKLNQMKSSTILTQTETTVINYVDSESMIKKDEKSNQKIDTKNEIYCEEAFVNEDNSISELLNSPTESIVIGNVNDEDELESIKKYICQECGKSYKYQSSFQAHQGTHIIGKFECKRLFQCDLCNKEFTQKKYIRDHMRNHSIEHLHSCTLCNRKFTKKYLFTNHMRTHTGERPFECNICNKNFTCKSYLNSHIKFHSDKRQFLCTVCGKSFKKTSAYKAHFLIHTGERPFPCTICNKSFQAKVCLQIHLRSHTGEKPYSCSVCNKSFQEKRYLTLHLKSHSNEKYEKLFHCTVCEKSFRFKQTLNLHFLIHTDQRLYECKLCEKAYKSKQDLTIHIRGHTGETPFNCSLCNKSFKSRKILKGHMKTHIK